MESPQFEFVFRSPTFLLIRNREDEYPMDAVALGYALLNRSRHTRLCRHGHTATQLTKYLVAWFKKNYYHPDVRSRSTWFGLASILDDLGGHGVYVPAWVKEAVLDEMSK